MSGYPRKPSGDLALSEHFLARELWCRGHCEELLLDERLVPALEVLRGNLGALAGREVAVIVNSGYRCRAKNARLPGASPNSKHLRGEAADVRPGRGASLFQLYQAALLTPAFAAGGIGVYPDAGFLHLDLGPKRRWGWGESGQTTLDYALRRIRE